MAGRGRGEDGYALVAALGAAVIFALLAYTLLAGDRGSIAALDAELCRARLEAAADAGVATAIDALSGPPSTRWRIDGRAQSLELDGIEVAISVEDEFGKIPLKALTQEQARRLFQAAGVSGARLDQLTAGLAEYLAADDRLSGAIGGRTDEPLRARGGPMTTAGELMALPGMDAALFGHVASSLSLFTSASDFDPGAATPLVRRVMTPPEDDRQGAFADPEAGRQAALAGALVTDYVGRPLTLRVVARDGRGGAFRRDVVVELTGQARQPYWIRAID